MGFTFKLNRSHFDKWRKVDNGNLLTYVHDESGSALQFTHARYKGKNKLRLPPEKLIHLATNATEKVRSPRDTYSAAGDCDFGKFGMVRLKGDEPAYFQAWVLFNERDEIIYVTYCSEPGGRSWIAGSASDRHDDWLRMRKSPAMAGLFNR